MAANSAVFLCGFGIKKGISIAEKAHHTSQIIVFVSILFSVGL